jgi:hypothetical protein
MTRPYSEGSVFLVPLRDGGFARGVVARVASKGSIVFGYFFGPRLESPAAATFGDLDSAKAALRIRFGDLGLMNGEWRLIDRIVDWNPARWPMPEFGSRDPLTGKAWVTRYCDKDPRREESRRQVNTESISDLPDDGLYGYGAAEIRLTKLLGRADAESRFIRR